MPSIATSCARSDWLPDPKCTLALLIGVASVNLYAEEGDRVLNEALAIMKPAVEFEQAKPVAFEWQLPFIPVVDDMPQDSEDDWLTMPIFNAVADGDHGKLMLLLASGANPNAVLPHPAPAEFVSRFTKDPLFYYTRRETGFTVLMLAAALGDTQVVGQLLQAGADKNKLSIRHKTFALYLAAKAGHIDVMRQLMGIGVDSPAMRYRVLVDLKSQRATLLADEKEVLATAISSGKKAKPTPTGTFLVTNKYRKWKSSIYDTSMPFFLRLSCGDFGFHAGRLPGYPASSGCIRLPAKVAEAFFATVPVGTLVQIE